MASCLYTKYKHFLQTRVKLFLPMWFTVISQTLVCLRRSLIPSLIPRPREGEEAAWDALHVHARTLHDHSQKTWESACVWKCFVSLMRMQYIPSHLYAAWVRGYLIPRPTNSLCELSWEQDYLGHT